MIVSIHCEPLKYSKHKQRRILVAIICGSSAGIVGLSNLYGFLFYFSMSFLISFVFFSMTKFQSREYFVSAHTLWKEGLFQGLLVSYYHFSSESLSLISFFSHLFYFGRILFEFTS